MGGNFCIPMNQENDWGCFERVVETEDMDTDSTDVLPVGRPYRASDTGGLYVEALTDVTPLPRDLGSYVFEFLHDRQLQRENARDVFYELNGRFTVVRRFTGHSPCQTWSRFLLKHVRRFRCETPHIQRWGEFIMEVSCQFKLKLPGMPMDVSVAEASDHKWYLLSALDNPERSMALRELFNPRRPTTLLDMLS